MFVFLVGAIIASSVVIVSEVSNLLKNFETFGNNIFHNVETFSNFLKLEDVNVSDDVKKIIDACQPGDGFLFCTDKAWIAPGDVNQNLIDAYNFAHEYSLSRTQK